MTKTPQSTTAAETAKNQSKPATEAGDKDVHGEGNYSAARRFDAQEGEFVEKNRQKIPELGKEAEKALDGPEGDELRKAEESARSHSHAPRSKG